MTLDDMAVEAAVHDQASFQVDEVAGLPGAEVGLFEGFFDGGHAVEVSSFISSTVRQTPLWEMLWSI